MKIELWRLRWLLLEIKRSGIFYILNRRFKISPNPYITPRQLIRLRWARVRLWWNTRVLS